jgi:hypothetical protein
MPSNQHKQRTFDRSGLLLPQKPLAVNRRCSERYAAKTGELCS